MKSFFQVTRKFVNDIECSDSSNEYIRLVHYKDNVEIREGSPAWTPDSTWYFAENQILLAISNDQHLKDNASSTGRDVHFTTLNGIELPFELVWYDSSVGSGQWWIYVKDLVDAITGELGVNNGISLYIKYGDASRIYDYSTPIWTTQSSINGSSTRLWDVVVHHTYSPNTTQNSLPAYLSPATNIRAHNSVYFNGGSFTRHVSNGSGLYGIYVSNGQPLGYVSIGLPASTILFGVSCGEYDQINGNTRQFLFEYKNVMVVVESGSLNIYAYTGKDYNDNDTYSWMCGTGISQNSKQLFILSFSQRGSEDSNGYSSQEFRVEESYDDGHTGYWGSYTFSSNQDFDDSKIYIGCKHSNVFNDETPLGTYCGKIELRATQSDIGYNTTTSDNYHGLFSFIRNELFAQEYIRTISQVINPLNNNMPYNLFMLSRPFTYQGLGGCNG